MRLQASTDFTFHGVTLRTVSLLAVLLLNIALIGPATILIVQETIDELPGVHGPSQSTPDEKQVSSVAAGHSADQVGKGSDGDSEKDSSHRTKRPKGVLLKAEVNKVFVLALPSELLKPGTEAESPGNGPVFVEAPLGQDTVPHELLRRPPPAGQRFP